MVGLRSAFGSFNHDRLAMRVRVGLVNTSGSCLSSERPSSAGGEVVDITLDLGGDIDICDGFLLRSVGVGGIPHVVVVVVEAAPVLVNEASQRTVPGVPAPSPTPPPSQLPPVTGARVGAVLNIRVTARDPRDVSRDILGAAPGAPMVPPANTFAAPSAAGTPLPPTAACPPARMAAAIDDSRSGSNDGRPWEASRAAIDTGADAVTAAGSIMLSIAVPPLSAGSREGSNDGFWSKRDSREGKASSVLVLLLPLLV